MNKLTPDGFAASEVLPKPAISEAKRRANQANARKSTGPKTTEGKANSSQNAYKHGLCSRTDLIHDVAPEVVEARLVAWDRELNPSGSEVAGFLVGLTVRSSFRLETCDRVYQSRVAKLGRDARETRKATRMSDVEKYARMLMTDADTAVRNLQATPEGCAFLLQSLEEMRPTVATDPPFFDALDEGRLLRLKGRHDVLNDKAPCPLYHCTTRMKEYRDLLAKLKLNERPEFIYHHERYSSPENHQAAKDSVPIFRQKAIEAAEEVRWILDREIAWLKARRDELVAIDEDDISESEFRARFDSSDEGKLVRRYESELERDFHRNLKQIHELNKHAASMPQPVSGLKVTPTTAANPAPAVASSPPRNEATVGTDLEPNPVRDRPRNEVKTESRPRNGRDTRKSNPRK